ncbi:MAG: protein translocase subunit SecF [Candidatus Wallbacteria bacterium]|nr:protein translocase subunit SecF [Candidatus Wallbacteria bacterium]
MTTNYDFIGKKYYAFAITGFLCIASIFLMFTVGMNWGVDFTGGTVMHLKFEKSVDQAKVRELLGDGGLNLSPTVQGVSGKPEEAIIRTKMLYDKKEDGVTKDEVRDALQKGLGNTLAETMGATDIGPVAGAQLRAQATKAVILSWIITLLYLWYRFEFKYSIGGVIGIIHDCIVTIGFFILFKLEVNITTMAALLTIIGYSINDSIIVCDRMRENIRLIKGMNYTDLFNHSINQMLTRTINTSMTVMITVVILFLIATGEIKDFAFAMIIGVITGTYSSIYIVGPIAIYFHELEQSRIKSRLVGKKKYA